MASLRRRRQIARRIQERLAKIFLHEMKDPRADFLTITGVELNHDLTVATVQWSLLDSSHRARVEGMIRHAAGFLRTEVAQEIQIKTAPKLDFHYDESSECMARIEALLSGDAPAPSADSDED